jgi:hypothetical protein
MFEHVCEFLLYLFATYGFAIFVIEFFKSIAGRGNGKGIKFCLLVKDCQDNIEGVVRSVMSSGLPKKYTEDRGITVIDLGSADQTRNILERLEKDIDKLQQVML